MWLWEVWMVHGGACGVIGCRSEKASRMFASASRRGKWCVGNFRWCRSLFLALPHVCGGRFRRSAGFLLGGKTCCDRELPSPWDPFSLGGFGQHSLFYSPLHAGRVTASGLACAAAIGDSSCFWVVVAAFVNHVVLLILSVRAAATAPPTAPGNYAPYRSAYCRVLAVSKYQRSHSRPS